MAKVIVYGKRNSIAEGSITSYGWTNMGDEGETFAITVNHTTRLALSRREAEEVVRRLTDKLTNGEFANAAGVPVSEL